MGVNVDIYDVDSGLLLLCSDGLTGNLRDEGIETLRGMEQTPEHSLRQRRRGGNITAVICDPR